MPPLSPIRLGGRKQIEPPPPRPKKIFIFKWLKLRFCDLMTFTENMRGSFWSNLGGGHKYFFRIFTDFQSETETPKNGKKSF